MPLKDAQNEARGTRRKQKRGQLRPDANKPKGAHQDGEGQEDQQIRVGGANRSRSDSDRSPGGTTIGGILRELMDEVDQQSAYLSSQLKKLSDRRRQLEDFYRELQAQAGQGNDVESEDKEELE